MPKAKKQTTTKDPVFALIEAHRNAIAAEDALNPEWHAITSTWTTWETNPVRVVGGREVPNELIDRTHAAHAVEDRARRDLIEAKPTTRAGKKARDEHLKANTGEEIQAEAFRVWPPGETPLMTPTEAIPHLDQMPAGWSVTDVRRTTTKSWGWVALATDRRTHLSAWFRIPGKHRTRDIAWDAMQRK